MEVAQGIIVGGVTSEQLDGIRQIVAMIDERGEEDTPEMKTFPIAHADPATIEKAIQNLVGSKSVGGRKKGR